MTGHAGPQRGQGGFTLLELLVAITLLGLLMAALFGGLRLGARVWETADARLDASARIQTVQDFIRQRLAETLPLETLPPDLAEAPGGGSVFLGEVEAIRFASLLPEHLGAGIHLMELGLRPSDRADGLNDLVLRWRPFETSDQTVDRVLPEERVLLENVEALELSYYGTTDPRVPPGWWQTWEDRFDLPYLIRIRVRFADHDDRRWPELIVRPMVDHAMEFSF